MPTLPLHRFGPAVLFALWIATPVRSASFEVGPHAWCDFPDLTQAVEAARSAGPGPHTVRLAGGTHTLAAPLTIDDDLTISGGSTNCLTPTTPTAPATVISEAEGAAFRIVSTDSANPPTVVLENLDLEPSGCCSSASAVRVEGPASLELAGVRVQDFPRGGLVSLGNAHGVPHVEINRRGGLAQSFLWSGNSVHGAVRCHGGSLRVDRTFFDANSSVVDGGAIFVQDCDLVLGREVRMDDNVAAARGGALAVVDGTVRNTHPFSSSGGNSAATGDFLWASGSLILLRDAKIGGDWISPSSAVHLEDDTYFELVGTPNADCPNPVDDLFCAHLGWNYAEDQGSALHIENSSARIVGAKIGSTIGLAAGSAAWVEDGELELESVLLSYNEGASTIAVVGDAETRLSLRYVTMSDNETTDVPIVVTASGTGGAPQIEILSSILWEPQMPTLLVTQGGGVAPDVHCALVSTAIVGAEVLVGVDPAFVDPELDFHLTASSPAIDFCDDSRAPTAVGDLEDEVRGSDQPGVPDRFPGATWDLGIDEYFGNPGRVFADGFETGDTSIWN